MRASGACGPSSILGTPTNMKGKLYIVATPIGNLGDLSKRAEETLREVDIVLAEDTRVTKKILDHLGLKIKMLSYHAHSGDEKKLEILNYILSGKNLALVTDAGTPGISDPGNELIDFIIEKSDGIKIIPIPGASAITTALSICGFNVKEFEFLGFFPKRKRTKTILKIKNSKHAIVLFESPNRLLKTIRQLQESLQKERRIFVARELTKMHEETYRGTASEILEELENSNPRGEVVVVVEKI